MNLSPDTWPRDIFVCIPAYQASETLARLLPELLETAPATQVLVVDDGSTDTTGSLCAGLGIRYLRSTANRGKGAALAAGFAALIEAGAGAIITMDADGQHAVSDIGLFVEEFRHHPDTGLCIGQRTMARGRMPFLRIVSNSITSRLLTWMCGVPIADSQCGYRLYAARFLRAITVTCPRFAAESEVLLKAARLDFPIRFIAVQTLYFKNTSHISHSADTLRWIKAVLGVWIQLRHYGISEPPHRR